MATISVICVEQDLSWLDSVFNSSCGEVKIYSEDVDFISCFDSDLLVVVSFSSLDINSKFFADNRLPILIERRLSGGRKVLCIGTAANLLFSYDSEKKNDFKGLEISFLEQWNAFSSLQIYCGKVVVKDVEKPHRFLFSGEEVLLENQLLVFEHPIKGLDCKYTVPPNVAWGEVNGLKVILCVDNGALSALLFKPSEDVLDRVISFLLFRDDA